MATPMYSLYLAVSNLVRMARRFLRIGDEARAERARDGIRSITENVGLTDLETQYPVAELLTTDLWSKLPQMNESGPYKHVLRFSTSPPWVTSGVRTSTSNSGGWTEESTQCWRLSANSTQFK